MKKCPQCGKENSDEQVECECQYNWKVAKIDEEGLEVTLETLRAYKEDGIKKIEWMTANDEFVCKVCNNSQGVYNIEDAYDLIINTHKDCKSELCRCCIAPVLD